MMGADAPLDPPDAPDDIVEWEVSTFVDGESWDLYVFDAQDYGREDAVDAATTMTEDEAVSRGWPDCTVRAVSRAITRELREAAFRAEAADHAIDFAADH